MFLSVIIPAFDEEAYLPETLSHLKAAIAACKRRVEVIVVDNASADRTAEIGRLFGATVVQEPVHNIARVRNTGARAAAGDVLVFLDADTLAPPEFLDKIGDAMADPGCLGGCPDVVHTARSGVLRLYLAVWRRLGLALRMAQGAAQFCRRAAFDVLNGYDESRYMGEDIDFYWRLRRFSATLGGHVTFLREVKVMPSPRRFDRTPVWRTLIWTNPLLIAPFRKTQRAWADWYVRPPR